MPQDPTPQDKKRKSLECDGRNRYGENDKSSRKAIRRRKAIVNRSFRRSVKQTLTDADADPDALNEHVDDVKRIDWKKVPDTALGEHLLNKLVSEIIRRVTNASKPSQSALDNLETQLIDTGIPHQAIQDIMRQLNGIVRARWSTAYALEPRAAPLNLDYDTAKTILGILNRDEA